MTRYTQRDAPRLIQQRKTFEASALSATSYYEMGGTLGPIRASAAVIWPEAGALYVVFSYTTPIGWIDKHGVAVITPHRYSITTSSKHMSKLWALDDDPGGRKRDKERAHRRYDKIIADYHQRLAEEKREIDRERARRRREDQRETRRRQRIQEQEEAAAVASILGRAGGGVILYGIEGEEEALQSITGDAYTRDEMERHARTRA